MQENIQFLRDNNCTNLSNNKNFFFPTGIFLEMRKIFILRRERDQTEVISHSNPTLIRDLYLLELKLLGVINPVLGRPFSSPARW